MGKCIFNLLSSPCTWTKSKAIAFLCALFPRISLRFLKLGDHHQCKAQQTTNRLGLCDIYLFYRLLSQRLNLESCFTNLEQTPLNRTGTVQTTYWLNQANLTTKEQLDNCVWVTGWWERGRWQISRKLSPTYTTLCCK